MNKKFVNELLDRLLRWETEEGKRLIEAGVDICAVGDDFRYANRNDDLLLYSEEVFQAALSKAISRT